ncbi:MAG: hypothetical protein JWP57_720 [Spirosoma sp.]|nr:hypothetical protein [Spirosoma sp.]
MPDWCRELCYKEPFRKALGSVGYDALSLPKGKIVGRVELVNTVRTDMWIAGRMDGDNIEAEWLDEFFYGDYSGGRFAWELANPVRYINPIPAKGSQGFWSFDLPDFVPAVRS